MGRGRGYGALFAGRAGYAVLGRFAPCARHVPALVSSLASPLPGERSSTPPKSPPYPRPLLRSLRWLPVRLMHSLRTVRFGGSNCEPSRFFGGVEERSAPLGGRMPATKRGRGRAARSGAKRSEHGGARPSPGGGVKQSHCQFNSTFDPGKMPR